MRVSRQEAENNRERVVDVAGRLFREHGFQGIGIADLMRQAGLTHGGFYKQFDSKQALEAEACTRVFADNTALWSAVTEGKTNPLDSLLRFYLSPKQLGMRKEGCAMAALSADAARGGSAVQDVFTVGINAHLGQLQSLMPDETEEAKRKAAMAMLSEMVGALILARAVDDRALAEDILTAARGDLADRRAKHD